MRIAFTLIGGRNWTGGHSYLLNLFGALLAHQSQGVAPVLFVSDECTDADLASFRSLSGLEIVRTPVLNSARQIRSLMQSMLFGRDVRIQDLLQSNRIDLMFESAQFFGWRLGIPAIAWIPDFQHKALPHLFPRVAWWKRELGFRAQVWGHRCIMLSSADANKACESYYPASQGRTGVVRFAVPPPPFVPIADARGVADGYGLPERFFFMPNQFWRHKNHQLVIEALALLRGRGMPVVVAAPGNPSDPRDPGYFDALCEQATKQGVAEDLRFLGLIPYAHVAMLMRAGTALLNPSLYEGWSTTVEEARAAGTPMILSDLDVHREQMGDQATYFDRNSPRSLADVLQVFPAMAAERREYSARVAGIETLQRVRQFASTFVEFADHCVRRSRTL